MGKKRTSINNTNNSSNVLSQDKILSDLNEMAKNDIKPQIVGSRKNSKRSQQQQAQPVQQKPVEQPIQEEPVQQPQPEPQQEPQPQQPKQGKQKNKKQQAQQPQQQPPQEAEKPDTSVQNTSKLLASWDYYTNDEWKNNAESNVDKIQTFNSKGNIKNQLDNVQEIKLKYTYKPEQQKPTALVKKFSKKSLRAPAKAPPGIHSVRMQQLVQQLSDKQNQRTTHDRVTNLLVKRYSQKMTQFADEYQKAYKVYQEAIKENLGVAEIKNSQINASKAFSHQKRMQKKAKLQRRMFRQQRKRVLESHTSPAKWTPAREQLFQMAVKKILNPVYNGFNYHGRPEYNRELAWVEANENTQFKESISVATVMACKNSPIPGETRLSQNRVPTVNPIQQKKSGGNKGDDQGKKGGKQQQVKEKPLIIKTQTPEQYRERISGKKPKKMTKAIPVEEDTSKKGKGQAPRKVEQKASPSVVNPGPATWVTDVEYPDNFSWGILQHQAYGNGGNGGRGNVKRSGGKKKDETLTLLFPKSAPNQGGKKQQQQQQQQAVKKPVVKRQNQKGINISDML